MNRTSATAEPCIELHLAAPTADSRMQLSIRATGYLHPETAVQPAIAQVLLLVSADDLDETGEPETG